MKPKGINLNLEYIAGFFDGDGCINLGSRGAGNLRVIFTNTRRDILEAINEYFDNLGKITTKKRTTKDFYTRPCYQLIFWCRRAEKVLGLIEDSLILKKDECRVAMEFMKTVRKKGAKRGSWGNSRLTDKIKKRRKELVNRCKNLKRFA